ncbi:MAG: dimethyl sulfoxide reductase anchor subunit family protein [Rhizomicrobium sp.]
MHPALSVIFFTTATGAGYGMLFWLGVFAVAGALPADRVFAPATLALSLLFTTFGLISSTFHLGHPERAWRALSQWRSSWLSREGVASIATYVPALLFGIGLVFFRRSDGIWAACAAAAALGALVTVVCSAYIYRSLKPVPRWANGWVLPNYLSLAAMTGAFWLAATAAIFHVDSLLFGCLAAALVIPAGLLKSGYWRHIDRAGSRSTAETATGLAGPVRLLDSPHTSQNYLLKEMGYRVARRHAARLRGLTFLAAFAVPIVCELAGLLLGGIPRIVLFAAAAPLATAGVLVERWLFFAEAQHTVTLYYGAARA